MIIEKGQNLNFAFSTDEFSEIEEAEEYFTLKEFMDYLKKKKKSIYNNYAHYMSERLLIPIIHDNLVIIRKMYGR